MVFCGLGRQNVNALLVQPFINYNFPDGWYFTSAPIITANWFVASDDRWTVPLGGGFGKVFKLGKQPINASLQSTLLRATNGNAQSGPGLPNDSFSNVGTFMALYGQNTTTPSVLEDCRFETPSK
jgi:hypothetical protein